MDFEPIAIIGRDCVLPGATDVATFGENLYAAKDGLTDPPPGRWRLPEELALGPSGRDCAWSARGGYVTGFQTVFDPSAYALDEAIVRELDPLFQWSLHCARGALGGAGVMPSERVAVVLGNLSFPSEAMTEYGERFWLEKNANALPAGWEKLVRKPNALNRFMSGLPAHFVSKGLGLGKAFALDAACATSLYALHLAAMQLWRREADVVLAGAVNRADSLFLHVGFCALSAMSRTGQSRPFHVEADGLVPAEGAAFVALERYEDAVQNGREILGVIRGIGLSNDGRGRGFLAPSRDGQVRALTAAYRGSDVDPGEVSYVECHATGTSLGDATELESMRAIWPAGTAIGSHKSNFGHAITAAGMAGLLKVLAAFERGSIAPTLHTDQTIDVAPFELVREERELEGAFAAINAFGFGGNNGHVLVERPQDGADYGVVASPFVDDPIAVTAVEMDAGGLQGTDAVFEAWTRRKSPELVMHDVELDLAGLRFPPRDLEQTIGQQLAILDVARRATEGLELDPERTTVLVGMGCDAEIVRYGGRWRLQSWGRELGMADADLAAAQDAFVGQLEAQGVVGSMPNIPANRINSQLDVRGPSFSVSSEELSGIRALDIARDLLQRRLIDTAVVGAVELADEEMHGAAYTEVRGEDPAKGDVAVVVVLERLSDAEKAGRRVLAVLDAPAPGDDALLLDEVRATFGDAHAANGLFATALAVLACDRGVRPGPRGPAPWITNEPDETRRLTLAVDALGEQCETIAVRSVEPARGAVLEERPSLWIAHGDDRAGVIAALRAAQWVDAPTKTCRAVVVAEPSTIDARREEAARLLEAGRTFGSGIHYRENTVDGDIGFVFTGSASPYPGMSAELAAALPEIVASLSARVGHDVRVGSQAEWVYETGDRDRATDPEPQVFSASWVTQLHAELSRNILGLHPSAAIGYSLGESNALFAMGAWDDPGKMLDDLPASKLFTHELTGDYAAIRKAWAKCGAVDAASADGEIWQNWTVLGPVKRVLEVTENEPTCHVTIINTDDECLIGGAPDACERVLEALLDDPKVHASPLPYRVAMHAPEVEEAKKTYRNLHRRPTKPVPGVRFYTNATGTTYELSEETIADVLVTQAMGTVDFPRTIRQAWDDGVRVFVEHGPRALCTGWISRILGDREHVAVSLDRPGNSDVRQVLDACAQLVAAGVEVEWRAFTERLRVSTPHVRERPLKLPAHKPPVVFGPPSDVFVLPMPPALRPAVPNLVQAPSRAPQPSVGGAHTGAPQPPKGGAHIGAPQPPVGGTTPTATWVDAGAMHAQFLRTQAAMHEQFIAHHQRSTATLVQVLGGAVPAPLHLPPTKNQEPPTKNHQPLTKNQEPPTKNQEPRTTNQEPRTKNQEPRTENPVVFSREDLEYLSRGAISRLFGPEFRPQDQYALQVRMPEPPLLLCDRVTALDAEPASMKPGSIQTQTDVREDSWYLQNGRMPAGVMIESGQADLLLISYLGVDLLNKGQRAYRLLGCKLTYKGELPRPGETLTYDIAIDGFAKHGDVRLFFFHYDCTVGDGLRLSVRNGQAGFFTYDELEESGGILWTPEEGEHDADAPVAEPAARTQKTSFTAEDVRAFAEGRPWECFGPAWEMTKTHLRTPTIGSGRMLFIDRVTDLDYRGGAWGKGYLRAETDVTPDEWFFDGHFHNDPCMPGTLMFEAALQTMAFYLAANGFTIDRDGWRFQPVQDVEYDMRCRGQCDPDSKLLVYEIFVERLDFSEDGRPRLFADMLVTVDGLKAFWCRGMGLELVPDYPMRKLGERTARTDVVADEQQVRAIQLGWPSDAFGPMYERFDGPRRVPRLPGPPYDTVSRVRSATGRQSMKPGAEIVAEYDVAADAWYFDEGDGTMPYAVLLEVGLQPCGWLASWVGCTLASDEDVFFRNLDGTGTLHRPATRHDHMLTTRATLTKLSRSSGMTIVGFVVETKSGDDPIYSMSTVFGFFPAAALASQAGITDQPPPPLPEPANVEPLETTGLLGLLQRVVHRSENRLTAEMDVDAAAWFFKAHFFSDPVQPGSLGLQLLLDAFELLGAPLDLTTAHTWKYRGQVRPWNGVVTVDAHRTPDGLRGWLWVDGEAIYRLNAENGGTPGKEPQQLTLGAPRLQGAALGAHGDPD